MKKQKISVIIPTYNEAGSIAKTIKEMPEGIIDEIVVVDLSTDGTFEIAQKLGCKVFKQRGMGFGSAFREGVEHSSGDIVILMDADGSHNPKDIPKLIKRINEGYDCVLASRYTIESHSEDDTLLRSFGNWMITNLVNFLFRVNTTDSLFLYTALRRKAYNKLKLESDGFEYCIEFLVKAYTYKLKLSEVPSIERARFAGRTKVNDLKHGYILIKSIFVWRYRLSKLLKKRNETA
jgi:glycosyltransferase involved in cell wall biosynthesis